MANQSVSEVRAKPAPRKHPRKVISVKGSAAGADSARAARAAIEVATDPARDALLTRLVERAGQGDRVLIVEPLAGFVARWWNRWRDTFEAAGGRADEWRLRAELPPIVAKLDRAAGLNHREITGRSLWLGGASSAPTQSGL